MRALTITLLVFALAVVSHQRQDLPKLATGYRRLMDRSREVCIKESGTNNELIEKMLNSGEFPEDEKLKCYLKCFLLDVDIIKPTGEVVEGIMRKNIGLANEGNAQQVHNNCKNIRDADLCEASYRLFKCIYEGARDKLE